MSTTIPPPPSCNFQDDLTVVDAARRRLIKKPRFSISLPNLRRFRTKEKEDSDTIVKSDISQESATFEPPGPPEDPPLAQVLIHLDDSAITTDCDEEDVYKWAVIYENQRGATIFSTPYYSSLSLLPTDPPPFTVPSTSSGRSQQPSVSLNEYPLPDGSWRWVSKSWLIDMRTEGQVQHDGFEYNWLFRKEKWRADVGKCSAGGWVRRRRWIRLMMRPAKEQINDHDGDINNGSTSWTDSPIIGGSISSSFLSQLGTDADSDILEHDVSEIWKGDDADEDWARCHMLMKRVGRDGRKLELWKRWLLEYTKSPLSCTDIKGKGKEKEKETYKQWTEDSGPLPSEISWALQNQSNLERSGTSPALAHIKTVLRKHGDSLLRSFIFPDSRAQLLSLLANADLQGDLCANMGTSFSASEVDFWSYTHGTPVKESFAFRASSRSAQDLTSGGSKRTSMTC